MENEIIQLSDREGNPAGTASRKECHSNPDLIQMIVYLQIISTEGKIYLQKRSETRESWPGMWDTAVGGHVIAGETLLEALEREAWEELGIKIKNPEFLFKHLYTKSNETELSFLYRITYDGPFYIDNNEVVDGRFFTVRELRENIGKGIFTPNLENEFSTLLKAGKI